MAVVEVIFPHRIEYQVSETVPIEEVIGTLQAQLRAVAELPDIMEGLVDGILVERVELRVDEIVRSSLKEAFFVGLFITYQKELEKQIPAMVESWLKVPVDDSHKTIVTLVVALMLYYGADYAYKKLTNHIGSSAIKKKLDDLIADVAIASGKTETEVRRIVEKHLSKKGRLRDIAKASVKFFRPSRNQGNAPILIGDKKLEAADIADVPNQVDLKALDKNEYSQPMYGTRIELRAKDHDHDGQGWGGIVRSISETRKPVKLYPNVSKDELWDKNEVWADILITYRVIPNGQEVVRYHIMKTLDPPPDYPS